MYLTLESSDCISRSCDIKCTYVKKVYKQQRRRKAFVVADEEGRRTQDIIVDYNR